MLNVLMTNLLPNLTYSTCRIPLITWAVPEGVTGGPDPPWKITMAIHSLDILVWRPLEEQLDPLSSIASRGEGSLYCPL